MGWDGGTLDLELRSDGEAPGEECHSRREKSWTLRAPGPTPPDSLVCVIRKGIMAQGHSVSKVFPNVPVRGATQGIWILA